MYRMTLVLCLLAVKLPMMAGETVGVTVHQTEWGDTRGEAPPPSGPSVPIKSDDPAPDFQVVAFTYGQNIRYATGNRNMYGQSVRYQPRTRLRMTWRQRPARYQPRINYRGAGKRLRTGSYRPSIRYGSNIKYGTGFSNSYRFGN